VCFTRIGIELAIPELSHLIRIRLITLAVFKDLLIKMLTYTYAVAVKMCTAAVDTFCGVIFIEAKDIDFPSRTTSRSPPGVLILHVMKRIY
jgi:hypothetical protein